MLRTVGLVGCGLIGQKRALAAAGRGLHVVALADLDIGRAQATLRSLGAAGRDARLGVEWQDVIAARPDLVVIATTHDVLAEISLAAIESGSHVLVEKPGARTAGELAPVLAAADRHRVLVKVGFNHRFHPAIRKAHDLVTAGVIGPLMFVRARYGHGGRVGMEREWRCQAEVSGGGELIDQGSHLIDLSRMFLGDFVDIHGVISTRFWNIAVEDNCFVDLRTAGGQIAWLHASWTEWKNTFSFEIYGRDGKLEIEGLGGSYGTERLKQYRMLPEMGPPQTTIWEFPLPDRSWDLELEDLIAAIAEGRQPNGNIYDAMENLSIIDKIYGQYQ